MFGYATELRSRTQGRGAFTMHFGQYEEVPRSIAEEIVSKMPVAPEDTFLDLVLMARPIAGRPIGLPGNVLIRFVSQRRRQFVGRIGAIGFFGKVVRVAQLLNERCNVWIGPGDQIAKTARRLPLERIGVLHGRYLDHGAMNGSRHGWCFPFLTRAGYRNELQSERPLALE